MSDLADVLAAHDVPTLIAHVSDFHLRAPGAQYKTYFREAWGEDHNAAAIAAMTEIRDLPRRPDLIVHTGDIVESSTPEEYAVAAELLSGVDIPLLLIPGNHDRIPCAGHPHGAFRAAYPTLVSDAMPPHPEDETFAFCWRFAGWDFIGIDTSDPREMPEANRRRAARDFAGRDPEVPAVVLTHSPLLPVGTWADGISFHDREFVQELTAHARIRLVLSGHVHSSRAWTYGRALHLSCPSLTFGIGCGVGYRLIGLDASGVVFSGTRFMAGARRDMYDDDRVEQRDRFETDTPERFETHPLRNPHVWPTPPA